MVMRVLMRVGPPICDASVAFRNASTYTITYHGRFSTAAASLRRSAALRSHSSAVHGSEASCPISLVLKPPRSMASFLDAQRDCCASREGNLPSRRLRGRRREERTHVSARAGKPAT